ncbi:type II secretion system F family protein [Endothiovibrio diazotrophicus]
MGLNPIKTVRPASGHEIEEAAGALAEQLEAGVPLAAAVANLPRLASRRHADQWGAIAEGLRAGSSLAAQLSGWWPAPLVAAVEAGEHAGRLPEVCRRIRERLVQGRRITRMAWRLAYPAGIVAAACASGLLILLWVIPRIARGVGATDSGIAQLSGEVHALLLQWGWPAAAGLVVGGLWLAGRLRDPAFRGELVGLVVGWPLVGPGLRQLHFGLWAYQLALLHATGGFELPRMLRLSAETLPPALRAGVERMAGEVERLGLEGAADPERTAPDDPRRAWPFYLVHAFALAHQTGRLDRHLTEVAPRLIEGGTRIVERLFAGLQLVAMLFAAGLVGLLFLAIYALQFGALGQAMGRGT